MRVRKDTTKQLQGGSGRESELTIVMFTSAHRTPRLSQKHYTKCKHEVERTIYTTYAAEEQAACDWSGT